MTAVLRLVQAEQFKEEIEIPAASSSGIQDSHSLQGALQYCSPWSPFIARYVVDRFSKPGERVLDPMCGAGTVGVEALLMGRNFIGASSDHTLVSLAECRIRPADLAEVALRLQFIPFKRPVNVASFVEPFPNYFHVATFRELVNAKTSLKQATDRASGFINFIITSILHGHTTGHLSAYTSPSEALSATAQSRLNGKRGEIPSYRALSPRILKKAAQLLQDGVSSNLSEASSLEREVVHGHPNVLDSVQGSSVDLAVLGLNQPGFFEHGTHSWLRNWWIGLDDRQVAERPANLSVWKGETNETLLEMARLVRGGGRVVLRVGCGRIGTERINYRAQIESIVNECLGSFWRIEGSLAERHVGGKKTRSSSVDDSAELLVLRRH